jgi:hypothetical protein
MSIRKQYQDDVKQMNHQVGDDTLRRTCPQETWVWGCIRTFLNAPTRGKSLHVPVALYDAQCGKGYVATFVLEALPSGAMQVFHHPTDAFTTRFSKECDDSLQQAWRGALELARREGVDVLCDGRWRLLRDGQPIQEVGGRSASGAAAWGWYFALTGKVPDESIIVVAQVGETDVRLLNGVDGVDAKVKAIADDGRFDTIVVASDDNQREAEDALRALGKLGVIRVKNLNASNA